MKRISTILLIFTIIFIIAGCGGSTTDEGPDIDPDQELIFIVDLCFINAEYAITGNEELSALSYFQNHNMFSVQGKQYFTLLDVMLRDMPFAEDSGIDTMIDDRIQFRSVEVKEGTAFVDIAGAGLSGSSLEEGLLISQIVSSLRGSFEEIERVQFLVDSKVPETLMGHYDTSEPFEEGIYPTGL